MADESEKGSVSKIVAATVREILGESEPNVSVKTLTITDGILGMTDGAKQECGNGTWILADTGATHDPVGLRKGDKIPTSTRPCMLQLAIGHVEGWANADGAVYIVSETQLPSIFPICRIIAECNMSRTLNSTGGDLVGHNGEKFAIVFTGSASLPFIHKNELERLRIHRKRCLRTRAVKSLMRLVTRWERARLVVLHQLKALIPWSEITTGMFCVDPVQADEVTMKGVVTCARLEIVFRALTRRRDLEDVCQLTFPDHMFQESGLLLMIHSSLSLEGHDIFWFLIIKRKHKEKATPSCPENGKQLS